METPTPSPPISSGQPKIIKYITQSAENFVTPTNIKSPQKSRTITLSALDMSNNGGKQISILLKNVAIQYIPDTGAAISVISEEVGRILNIEIKPYDKSRIKAVTAGGESSDCLLGEKDCDKQNKSKDIPFIKNVGFVNKKWTEILVEDEEESDEMDREEIKRAIVQMTKREEHNSLDNWTDKFISVNHKTYVPV